MRRLAFRVSASLVATVSLSLPAAAQQRPLVTEDPESIGSGRVLVELGIDYWREQSYPASGLQGNLLRLPTVGVSFGISPIAEIQIDGGLHDSLSITSRHDAPLSTQLQVVGNNTSDAEDIVIGTKVRLVSEARHPSIAFRFATRLPNASNESGLGLDTFDFYSTVLIGKTTRSIRVVGNVGLGILADPTNGTRQNDVMLYGVSVARALTTTTELVGELNGRASVREGDPFPGTESRSQLRIGARYTHGAGRVDGGIILGLTSIDPSFGFTVGYTHVFNVFRLP